MIHMWTRTLTASLAAAGLMMALAGCTAPAPSPTASAAQTTQARLEAVRAALEAKQFEAALQQAQALVTDDPNNAEAHYLLGNAHNQLASAATDETTRRNHLTKAVDAYLTAIRLDPQHDAAHTNLATVYYQNGQFEQAQEYVQKALQLKPDDAISHYMLGAILLQRDPQKYPDALDTAQKQFEAAIRYKPDLGAAYTGLANVFLFKGDYQKALENAQKGVDLTQNDPNPFTYWALAQAQCALGDKVNGTKSIQRINSLNPADPLFRQQVQALAEQCR
ncbi:MAG: tetratricopeptide repeat protein [Anaerolineae bacterium]|nr:tetratricopeptide repeat protein [Thermoflexales bacterium]MDW8407171.1 tetratricopeptide repeat protein [Anaerolineae bacterium]